MFGASDAARSKGYSVKGKDRIYIHIFFFRSLLCVGWGCSPDCSLASAKYEGKARAKCVCGLLVGAVVEVSMSARALRGVISLERFRCDIM